MLTLKLPTSAGTLENYRPQPPHVWPLAAGRRL
jgi:hypothetical protein